VWGPSACSDREAAHWYRGSAAPMSERWGRVAAAAMRGVVAAVWSNRARRATVKRELWGRGGGSNGDDGAPAAVGGYGWGSNGHGPFA